MKIVVAALLAIAAPVAAQDAPAAKADQPKERKICRRIVPTGTIMAKQFCLTKREWGEFDDQNARHNEMVRDRKTSIGKSAMGD